MDGEEAQVQKHDCDATTHLAAERTRVFLWGAL